MRKLTKARIIVGLALFGPAVAAISIPLAGLWPLYAMTLGCACTDVMGKVFWAIDTLESDAMEKGE
tara:strand:+ start:634 stop:831 length:198 start_codon:yes stop_codon:yes gene_type:complete